MPHAHSDIGRAVAAQQMGSTKAESIFFCEKCYWDQIGYRRERLDPPVKQLKCLCTRRQNLEILLINREFHEEAAFIFWTKNWFAFEHHSLLIGFISALRPHIKALIRRATLLPDLDVLPRWMPSRAWWESLKQCPGLLILKLDAPVLSNKHCVFALRNFRVNGRVSFMRQVQFKDWIRRDEGYPNSYIWPAQALRWESRLPFAEMSAASLTGETFKTKWLKRAYFQSQLYVRDI